MVIFDRGVGDFVAISKLVAKVSAACEDAPSDYRHFSKEVMSLQAIINMAVKHFESTTFSGSDQQLGQEILERCQSVLEDLNPAPVSDVKRVMLSAEDIKNLRARLMSNTVLLNGFVQRFNILTITIDYIMLISLPQL